ncbi:MAG TPA: hypothetical protein VG796_06360 [Verrucomicrobiales bacterium]|nr:hypothetical protein [Verrucomicrobiales bacterium]
MKSALLFLPVFCLAPLSAKAVLLFGDNFNAPDTGNLDLSSQAGRRSGTNTAIQVRSSWIQHGISGNQLNFLFAGGNTGRVRFHNDLDNNTGTAENWHDWAAGEGASILAAGGLRIEFDWIAGNNTSDNWVAFDVGHSSESAGEPGFRVNHGETDLGILFRYDGRTEIFDNGVNLGPGGTLASPIVGLRHIMIDYRFNSFADGSPVTISAWESGSNLYNGAFTWSGNAGQFYMELETIQNTLIDNFTVSTVPEPSGALFTLLSGLALTLRRRR